MYTESNYGSSFEKTNQKALYQEIVAGKYTMEEVVEKVSSLPYPDRRGLARAFKVEDCGNESVDALFSALVTDNDPIVLAEMVWKGGIDYAERSIPQNDQVRWEAARYHSMEAECVITNLWDKVKSLDEDTLSNLTFEDACKMIDETVNSTRNAVGLPLSGYCEKEPIVPMVFSEDQDNHYTKILNVKIDGDRTARDFMPGIKLIQDYMHNFIVETQHSLEHKHITAPNLRYINKDLDKLGTDIGTDTKYHEILYKKRTEFNILLDDTEKKFRTEIERSKSGIDR